MSLTQCHNVIDTVSQCQSHNVTMSLTQCHNVTCKWHNDNLTVSQCHWHSVTMSISQCNNVIDTVSQCQPHSVTMSMIQCHNERCHNVRTDQSQQHASFNTTWKWYGIWLITFIWSVTWSWEPRPAVRQTAALTTRHNKSIVRWKFNQHYATIDKWW